MSSEKKQVWRFTFGSGQYNEGYCQPIFGTFASARAEMVYAVFRKRMGRYQK